MKLLITKERRIIEDIVTKPELRLISTPQKLIPESTENISETRREIKSKKIPVSIPLLNIENLPDVNIFNSSRKIKRLETNNTRIEIPLSIQSHGIGITANGSRTNSI
jgi:hypothetical protein